MAIHENIIELTGLQKNGSKANSGTLSDIIDVYKQKVEDIFCGLEQRYLVGHIFFLLIAGQD